MRLLIVEDDREIARSLARGLELESYAVDVAHDGPQGLDLALGGEYDLVILDWMLPGLDGPTVCERLRAVGITAPVLMLTARDALQDRVRGLDAGADDYLAKPFAFEELSARVRAILRRPIAVLPPVLRVADLSLRADRRGAERAGVAIELTAREFAVLEQLMRRPGTVFSRRELTERLWSAEHEVLETNVETYISQLRVKIDRPFSGPKLIHTVWGRGYRIAS